MGAVTSNRKRGDGYFSLSYPYLTPNSSGFDHRDIHSSKKPRTSYVNLNLDHAYSSKSAVTRIYRYPDPTHRFHREVHAPCRQIKFGASVTSNKAARHGAIRESEKEETIYGTGNYLIRRYIQAKNVAIGTFRHWTKDKEVIDVKARCVEDAISEDSSVEEVEILDEGRQRQSVVSDKRLRESNVDVFLQEAYAKIPGYPLKPSSSEVDYTGKMMEALSVRGVEELGIPPHKRLYQSAESRNSRLGFLNFEISFHEKKLALLHRHQLKKPEEDVLREFFTPLTDEEQSEVSHALSGLNRRKALVRHEDSNIEITGEILQCLGPGAWLNDEVINLYLELLKEREKREPKRFLKCHFFNTFFYKKLISGRNGYDFKAVRRWTTQRKIGYGLFECDKIFVPIHKEIHWCLAVINKKDEKFQYLDSLNGTDSRVLKVLARYFVDEVKDKTGKDINISSWKQEYVDNLPEQENGWDCGMFMIKYADFYSRGSGLCFKQEHMPYFRMRTAKEILRLKAE